MRKTKKRVVAFLLIVGILCLNIIPVRADVKGMEFTSIKGVDYIQLRERTSAEFGSQTAYNFDLQIVKDEGFNNSYEAGKTNPFTFGSLEDTNKAWENVKPAYCMEHSLGYPHGISYTEFKGFEEYFEKAFANDEMRRKARNGVLTVMSKGYPYNKEYWSKNGVENYGAQLYATQVAIWYVLTMYGGENNTGIFNGYTNVHDFYRRFIDREDGSTQYFRLNPKYEGIDGLVEMLIYLRDEGMNGEAPVSSKLLVDSVGEIEAKGENFEAYFIVDAKGLLEGYRCCIDNILGDYKVYLNDEPIEIEDNIFYSPTCNGRDLIRIEYKRQYNASTVWATKAVEISVEGNGGIDTQTVKCYETNELTVTGSKRQKIMVADFASVFLEADSYANTPREKLGIRLAKTDESGQILLKGAKFGIYAAKDVKDYKGNVIITKDTLIEEIVTNEDGCAATTKDYPYGMECYIKEIEAPYGYIASSEIKYVILTDEEISLDFENENQEGDIYIHKTGEKLIGFENGNFIYEEQPLEGAVFEILDETNALVATVTTDKNGDAVIKNLPLGKYFIKEKTAPYGYKKDDNVYEVNLTYDKNIAGNVSQDLSVTNERIKVSITINKYASDTKETLSQAEFGIFSEDGLLETIVTNDEGVAKSSLDYPLGNYYVMETVAPKTYKISQKVMELVATEDNNTFELNVSNDPIIGKISLSYGESTDIPKTKDNNNILLYIFLAVISVILLFRIKKKKTLITMLVAGLLIISPVTAYAKNVKEVVNYNNRIQLDDFPNEIEVERYDEESNSYLKGQIPYKETIVTNERWQKDFSFEITFSRNDAAYYELGDKRIKGLEDLYEHKEYLLELLELDSRYYKIDEFIWKNGSDKLVAIAKGQRFLRDFQLVYEGELETETIVEDTDIKAEVSVSYPQNTGLISVRLPNTGGNNLSDEVSNPLSEGKVVFISIMVLIFLLIFLIIHIVHKKRQKFKEDILLDELVKQDIVF